MKFEAHPDEILKALAEIPDSTLLAAYEREWTSRGVEAPIRTADELRVRIAAAHANMAAAAPREVLLTVSEAALELDEEAAALRRRIDKGELDHAIVRENGAIRLRFVAPPRRWRLIPERLRPDPRSAEVA